jgi:hypothetical protein
MLSRISLWPFLLLAWRLAARVLAQPLVLARVPKFSPAFCQRVSRVPQATAWLAAARFWPALET